MINIFEPAISSEAIKNLEHVFNSKWLGRGLYVKDFESKLAGFLNISNCNLHTISCCTDAIFGVFDIFDIKRGSEIIVPAVSFPAVGSSILASGMIPKIIDVDIKSGNIDLDLVGRALSTKTAAIFVTHYGGIPVNIPRLREIVGPKIKIFEDAACAFGTYINGEAIGTQGDFGCWSFDAMKLVTCGEGGAFFIKDSKLINFAKEYFYLGLPTQARSGIDRQANESRWWEYQLTNPGRRSLFSNINAAIGLPQFESVSFALEKKAQIRAIYVDTLMKVGCNFIRQESTEVQYSNYFFTVLSKERDKLANYLKQNDVYTTLRYYPLNLIDLFKGYSENCPAAIEFSNEALNIPIHQNLTDDDVQKISDLLYRFHIG